MDQAPPKKMAPGDDMHLTLLMAPHNLNLVTGQDRQHLLAFGRAAFEAGKAAAAAQQGVQQSIEQDVRAIVDLLKNREWAEHIGQTELGRELEHEITKLYNATHPTPQGAGCQYVFGYGAPAEGVPVQETPFAWYIKKSELDGDYEITRDQLRVEKAQQIGYLTFPLFTELQLRAALAAQAKQGGV